MPRGSGTPAGVQTSFRCQPGLSLRSTPPANFWQPSGLHRRRRLAGKSAGVEERSDTLTERSQRAHDLVLGAVSGQHGLCWFIGCMKLAGLFIASVFVAAFLG